MDIQLRHLRYFLAVLEELHFGRAAQRLHISQPPLSSAIQKLEEELGVKLFQRNSRIVAPTEAATAFAEEARKALASVDRAVLEARRAGGAAAALRVGCSPHFPVGLLQLFLGKLHERGQTAHAEVNHLLSVEQLRRLRTGDLDLAIIHRTEEGADIETEPLFRGENLKMLLGADHRLAERARVRPEDIRDEVLFVLPRKIQPRLYDLTMNLLHDHGYSFRDVREVGATDPRDVIQAVVAESGVTVAPAWFHPDDPAEGVVAARPLEPPVLGPDIAVAWLANPPARLTSVAQAAREIARELYLTRR